MPAHPTNLMARGAPASASACVAVGLGLQDLRHRDVGLVGYRLVRGVHGRFHGRAVFAERVGPGPDVFRQIEVDVFGT